MLDVLKEIFTTSPKLPKILIFCGAGISAESGLNTFRDTSGIWTQYDMIELCNLNTFYKNKEKVFDFYNFRKSEILTKTYNEAHVGIMEIQKTYGVKNVQVFTSNIDNLLEKAGVQNVTHVHGDIFSMKCVDCNHVWSIGDAMYDMKSICPVCASDYVKPSIIFFNEIALEYKNLNRAFESSGEIFKNHIIPNIKLIVGTSFNVLAPEVFRLKRGYSILVDPRPNIQGFEEDFKAVITQDAKKGIKEAQDLIKTLILTM